MQQELIPSENVNELTIRANNENEGIKGKLFKDVSPAAQKQIVSVAVAKALLANSKKMEATEMEFIISEFRQELLRAFPGIRVGEVGLAVHKGAMGEYDKIYNLGLSVFVSFIRSYMNSDLRLTAFKNNNSQGQLLLTEYKPSEADLSAARKDIVLNAFDKFKKFSHYNDHGNYVFDSLAKMGVLNFTEAQVNEIWKYARKNVFSDLYHSKTSLADRNERMKKIEEVKANSQHYLFFMEAKKIGLKLFFDDLVKMETELNDLLDEPAV